MNAEELAEIVENLRVLGSDVADVEVKKAQGGLPKSLRETLSAFSNTRGGVVILGLDEGDRFMPARLADPAKLASDLASLCSSEIEPAIRPYIQIHPFEGAQLVVAEVPEIPREQKPCYYKGAGLTKGAYTRLHDGDRQLSSYEVQMMLSARGQPKEDSEPVAGVGIEALDSHLVAATMLRLRSSRPYSYRDLSVADILRRTKVLIPRPDGSGEDVSVGGLLALGSYPQEHFPQLMLTFVHYPTVSGPAEESGVRFLDSVAIEGPIPVMVRDALAAIRRNMSRRSITTGAGRQDIWEYPETALREAITNALVHRDLSAASRGAQVQVEMFPDRLVIRNAGGLYGPVTLENLGEEGATSSRNAALLRVLEDVPIPGEDRTVCENRGSGIRAMLISLRRSGMTAPKFDDRISSFVVTFPNHSLLNDDVVRWIGSLGEAGLTDGQCMALGLMHDGTVIDNASYRKLTGLDSRKVTAELQDLVGRELVEQVGTGRWARYRLAERLATGGATDRPSRMAPADRREEILDALGTTTASRAELAARTGLSDQTVRRWLTMLRREGLIEATETSTASKHTKYRRTYPSPDPKLF
ncbi:ATP-binding protein [Paractinoplanes atraurantiacus]|uniref:ATP-dependent DNA helicase RecG n=1 Tax=Paractinoplanes atraurantiacus TaxID=1036182 RepID=A0A285JSL1_9ACTN|nr:ATP-binding protein [Actinoplanes atraurantiacus]SNY63299.1 ATP-dependent DNA helicase RecG [Actinoplanes atraurantiacus]